MKGAHIQEVSGYASVTQLNPLVIRPQATFPSAKSHLGASESSHSEARVYVGALSPATSAAAWIGARRASTPRHTQECLVGVFSSFRWISMWAFFGLSRSSPPAPASSASFVTSRKKHFGSARPFFFFLNCTVISAPAPQLLQHKANTHTRAQEHALAHLTRSTTEQSLYVTQ